MANEREVLESRIEMFNERLGKDADLQYPERTLRRWVRRHEELGRKIAALESKLAMENRLREIRDDEFRACQAKEQKLLLQEGLLDLDDDLHYQDSVS